MKSFTSKILTLTLFASLFGAIQFVNAQTATPSTQTSVSNFGPTITVTPSDGGSATGSGVGDSSGNPTNDGSDVTFTVTATDVNSDEYFLAVCSTDAVNAGAIESDPNPPTCATDDEWEISAATDSDVQATAFYTTGTENTTAEGTSAECTSAEECQWFAFVCENIANANSPICFPTSGDFSGLLGDKGRALGTITISDVPADQTLITIDTKTYEFDNGGSCDLGPSGCINTATFLDGQDAAAALVTSEGAFGDATSNTFDRGTKVYVYATAAGTGGNAIALEVSGDTGGVVEIVGDATVAFATGTGTTTVTDVTADNVSPFAINHAPAIGTVTIGDTIGTGLDPSTGTASIAPGDTLYFSVAITDADVRGSQDTINMYVCSGEADTGGVTTAFDTSANTCTNGTLICSDTNVNPTTDNARCSDTTLITVPTAHQTYDVQIFIEDNHDFAGTGTNLAQYAVIDVAPVLNSTINNTETGGDGYIEETTNPITPTAGGNQNIDFIAQISDDNGDRDITGVTAVFYDFSIGVYDGTKNLTAGICAGSATDENDCYVFTTGDCTLGVAGDAETEVSAAGSAGEKLFTGDDKNLQVNCAITSLFEFNANASLKWQSHVNIIDELGTVINSSDSAAITNGALAGLDLVQTQILYRKGGGAITQGGTSDGQETSIGNVGNQVIDVLISGTDMVTTGNAGECADDPKCIELEDQKWHSTTQNFDWDTDGVAGSSDAAWALAASSATTSEATGCSDRSLAVRAVAVATTENESVYWKIRIPAASAAGTYTGTNTFSSTSACTGSFSH